TLLWAGRLRESDAVARELESLLAPDPDFGADLFGFSVNAMRRVSRATLLVFRGRLREALPILEQGLEISHRRQDIEVMVTGHNAGVTLAEFTGDAALAAAHVRRFAEVGSVLTTFNVLVNTGRAELLAGRYGEAVDALARGIAEMRARRLA